MKKVLILILAVILSLSVFAMAACQQPCEIHVDTNHDGICDVCEEAGLSVTHTDSNHDGKCDDCAGETTFEHVDAAHDGKCDVCNKNVEIVHVDANKDGSCDVCDALVEHEHTDADNNGICDVPACDYEFPWVANLAAAAEYVNSMYLNENATTAADYKVTTVVTVGGVEYTIVWSITSEVADQTSAVIGEIDADKKQTINVDEFSANEVAYTLVGTISDAAGHSATVEYDRKVPKFVVATWEEYLAACEASSTETSVTVRGYITAVNADPTSGSKASVWFRDAEGHGYYAYSPKVDASVIESRENILAEFPVGAEIVVSGTVGNRFGPQHNAGCTIVKTGNTAPAGWNTPVDQTEAFSNASSNADEALQPLYGSIVTLKGITMGTPNGLDYYFTINGKQYICRMNIYLTDEAGEQAMMDKWVVGGKANLTGLVTTYSNKFQIYPYGPDCIEIVKEELTDAQIVERAKGALSFDTNHVLAASEIELPAEIAGYEVSLAWALDKDYAFASIADGKLVVSELPAEATTIKLVATIAKGSASDTLEFEIDVDAAQVGAVTEVNLTVDSLGLVSDKYQDGTATVGGVSFEFVELGNYGSGIQSRNKTKASALWNTTAFESDIVSVEITITDGKAGYDNENVFMLSFGATADALTEEISHNEAKGVLTYTYTPSAGARFFKMIKTNTYSSYYASIKITLAEVKEEGPLAEGKAYTMSVVQGNLGKTLYFNGTTREADGYPLFFKTSENVADAAHVFVEAVDGGYKLYFMNGETKTYIRLYERSAGSASLALVTEAPAEVYTWDETYATLKLTVGSNSYYIGTYGTYDTLSGSSYSKIVGSFPCAYTPVEGGTVVPPVEEHKCESVCPECGKCLDEDCAEAVCAEKCEGHTPVVEASQVVLTVNSLGLKSQSYAANTVTVDGSTFEFVQLGNYGNGIQMRDKNGNTSLLWNTVAFSKPIARIELVYSSTQNVTYANANAVIFSFGSAADSLTYTTKLSTVAGQKNYTITPDAETYTFFKLEHDLGYTFYWDSITIVFAEGGSEVPPAVVINGTNYSEDQAEEALLAIKADDVVVINTNGTIDKEYTFAAADYTLGEGAVLVAQANMVAPAGTKLTVSANAKLVVESGATIDISALTQENFATSTEARLEIANGATVIMPAYTEALWKDAYLKVIIEQMVADSDVGAKLVLGETKLTKTADGWEAEAPAVVLEDVVINVSDLADGNAVGETEVVAGSGVWYTAIAEGKNIVIEEKSGKEFEGVTYAKRLKFPGTMKNENNVVTNGFRLVLPAPCKITVYAIAGNKDATNRNLVLKDSAFADIKSVNVLGDQLYKVEFEVSAAGTYYLGSSNSGMNIYYLAIDYTAD